MQQELQSLRTEEKQYEQQIRQTYKQYPHLFVTHSSDILNLDIVSKTVDFNTYKSIVAKSNFNKFDIITEIRGSIIGYNKLVKIIEEGKVDRTKLPILLYLNFEQKYLLSPKNIAKYLFTHPSIVKGEKEEKGGNCYIQNHFGSKLFAIASRDITAGEQLILEQQSYERVIYKYNPDQF